MNTEEIKEQIDMQKLIIENHKLCLNGTEKELALLESQLAEAEKPGLRDGEIRQWPHCIGIVDMSEPQTHLIWADGTKRTPCASDSVVWPDSKVIGNLKDIFADLEARQEPLEHFRVCGLDVGLNELGNIQLTNDDKDTLYIHSDDWHNFILNLQRLVYTAEQEAAK